MTGENMDAAKKIKEAAQDMSAVVVKKGG